MGTPAYPLLTLCRLPGRKLRGCRKPARCWIVTHTQKAVSDPQNPETCLALTGGRKRAVEAGAGWAPQSILAGVLGTENKELRDPQGALGTCPAGPFLWPPPHLPSSWCRLG